MFNNKWLYLLTGLVIGAVLTLVAHKEVKQKDADVPASNSTITNISTLDVKPKENPKAPDLIVTTDYVANINGKEIKAPMVTSKDNATATVSTTIDVTPLVKQMTPKWEVGAGVGYDTKTIVYPISIQRNYTQRQAVEFIVRVDHNGKLADGMILHKWCF